MQWLGQVGCPVPMRGLKINLGDLLKNGRSEFQEISESGTPVIKSLRKTISREGH